MTRPRLLASTAVAALSLATASVSLSLATRAAAADTGPRSATAVSLSPGLPTRIALRGRYDEYRLLTETRTATGPIDTTGLTKFAIAPPTIAVIDDYGTVRPLKDGKATLIASEGSSSIRIPIEVTGFATSSPPRFVNDVIPILTRAGCNMGACHGAGSGKGGFKLSLQGYDPDIDYANIVRGAAARRAIRSHPEQSLILRKATLGVVHKGGQRFRVGSPEYRLIRDWIAAGTVGPSPREPRVVRLAVTPVLRTLKIGQTQRYNVRAVFSDGMVRDVTSQTLFTASDETVATVTPEGEAKATGPGEGAVLLRYQGLVATAHVISPFAQPIPTARAKPLQTATAAHRSATAIDQFIQQKLDSLGLRPSPRCGDSDFIRRATLDVTGLLPAPDAVRAFLADTSPNKREKLIDRLLESGEYVDFWTLKWGDLLRSSRKLLSDKGMAEYSYWIRRSVADNVPWDRFAREVLVAQGSPYENGPSNFFRTASTANELAEATSQTFLGVRMQCARCHNHPYEKWTQNQYFEMAAFFAKVKGRKGPGENEQLITAGSKGEVTHPKTAAVVRPCALDDRPVPADYRGDRRAALAEWLTSARNPFFAKCITNRLWKHFMGRGLVEPVDDLRVTNPPSNSELYDYLGEDLATHNFDLKHTMRAILLSAAYQRSAVPTPRNERDTRYYSHYGFKRLSAEQLMDAIAAATGVPEKFAGYPLGVRASQLPDTTVPSYFLELFGRPARSITCACERTDDPNLGQVLHLMNNAGINTRLASPSGRITALIKSKMSTPALVRDLYLAAYSRPPSPDEEHRAARDIDGPRNSLQNTGRLLFSGRSYIPGYAQIAAERKRRERAEDLLWALMNTKEFVFNH